MFVSWKRKKKKQSWRYNHSALPTHNFLMLVGGWFSLSFSSQTIQKIFSISHFQFSKFQNSWWLEILSELPLFKHDSKVALTRQTFFSKQKIVFFGVMWPNTMISVTAIWNTSWICDPRFVSNKCILCVYMIPKNAF